MQYIQWEMFHFPIMCVLCILQCDKGSEALIINNECLFDYRGEAPIPNVSLGAGGHM